MVDEARCADVAVGITGDTSANDEAFSLGGIAPPALFATRQAKL